MRSHGVRFEPQTASPAVLLLLDRVYSLENRCQDTEIAAVFLARFSGEPSGPTQGSLENRPIPPRHRPVPGRIRPPGRAAPARSWSPTGRILDRDMAGPSPERNEFFAPDSSRSLQKTSPSSLRQQPFRPKVEGRRPVRPPFGSEMSPKQTPIAAGQNLRAPSVFDRNGRSSAHSTDGARPGGEGICLA